MFYPICLTYHCDYELIFLDNQLMLKWHSSSVGKFHYFFLGECLCTFLPPVNEFPRFIYCSFLYLFYVSSNCLDDIDKNLQITPQICGLQIFLLLNFSPCFFFFLLLCGTLMCRYFHFSDLGKGQ